MKKQNGFTLIELVIVIIVLGILAATAVPKFINLQDDAKVSAMKGVEAAVHSAANIVYSKAAIGGVETTTGQSVSAAGSTVAIDYGYPTATAEGIVSAVEVSGFDAVFAGSNTITFVAERDKDATDPCILYTQATTQGGSYTLQDGRLAGTAGSPGTGCTPN